MAITDADVKFTANTDGTIDIKAKQGATWEISMTLKNDDGSVMDLTGWGVRGQIRAEYADASPVAEFTFDNDLPNGAIKAVLAASVTAGIPFLGNKAYVYDFERYLGDVVRKDLPHGKLYIVPEVTK